VTRDRASGICASIAEMAAWTCFHLDPVTGRDGLRLLQAAATELTAPQIYICHADFAEIGRVNYGFGFFVGDYRGARSLHHNGGPWCGYNCDLHLLPDHGSGVMVLTNGNDPGCAPLTNTILDHLLGLEPLPWLKRFSNSRAARRDHPSNERSVRVEARRHDVSSSHALVDYANKYEHPAYGKVRITCDGDSLRWTGLSLDLPMIHRHHDVFETVPEQMAWFGNWTVQFATGIEGHIESLAVPLEPAVAPIKFRRLP
jgi:Domain of unknown function (DUF3471)/Beta-lactamase